MTMPMSHIGAKTPGQSATINNIIDRLNATYGAVQYSQPNSQTLTAASDYEALTGWQNEQVNTLDGQISTSAPFGIFTFNSPATVAIGTSVSFLHGATEYRVAVFVNNTNIRQARFLIGSAATTSAHSVSISVFDWTFAAGDTVSIQAYANATGISTTAAASETWWRMRRVG